MGIAQDSETFTPDPTTASWKSRFLAGALSMLPLMIGVIPFGIVFGASARAGGWSALQTQAMSMILFAGASQLVVLGLVAAAAAPVMIVLTVAILNVRHLLYSMSLARTLAGTEPPPRWLLAFTVTDESYAMTIRESLAGRATPAFLWGSSLTLYVLWALATLLGILIGDRIPDPQQYGLDLIFPLTFLALLLSVAKTRREWAVALLSAALAYGLSKVVDGGTALFLAIMLGAFIGALVIDRPR